MILKRIFLFLILVSALFVSNISAQQIYTNGSLSTGGINAIAASAPTGYNWSELQVPNGSNGSPRADFGYGRLADNFTVTCGPWTVSKFVFYAFCEFNNQITVSPFNHVRVAVYNGNPATGGTLIYGDTTTNRFSSSTSSKLYRIQNGVRDTTREIWKVEATLNIPSLANGEYWVVYNLGYNTNTVNPAASSIFSYVPASTIVGSATQDGNNALYKNTLTAAPWAAVTDNGGPQDLPFDIKYTTPACTSIPTGVATNSTANTVCSAVPFTLSLGACIGSGATYQWQYKVGSGLWVNIAGATNNILSTTISATSRATAQFRASLYCPGDGESIPPSPGFSNSITINLNNDCYCLPPTSNSRLNDKITNVTFGGINNNSDTSLNGYSNYTTTSPTPVAAGNIFSGIDNPISVKVGPGGTEYVGVWIDYNQNSIFEASEFKLLGSGNGVTISSTISVPVTALTGLTRMRVRVSFSRILSGTEACSAFQTVQGYGETEDYSVNITAAVACNTVNLNTFAFTTSSTLDSVCTAESFTLTASSPTQSLAGISGIKYQWQSSATGNTNDFTDILNDTLITHRGTQSSATYYRLKITCTLSSSTVYSASKYIRMKSSLYCYCVPSSNGADNDIALNVTFGGINNSSGSALNGSGYSDYTGTVTRGVAFRNTNNPISVKINTYWTERVAVWIDYDRSGTFDASEFTFVGSHTGTATPSTIILSNNIAVPNTALLGLTRMRVRVVFSSTPTGTDACTTYSYGEAEDYLVDIRDLINCSGTPSIGTISSTSNTSCSGDSVILRVSNSDTLTGTTGLAIQWLSSPTINGVYAPIAGATSPIYTATITAETYFKLQVTCSNGGVTSTSQTPYQVSLTPSTQCYCSSIAGLSNNSDITNVTVGTIGNYAINNASDCNSTAPGQGSVANLYSNYTTLPADTIYSGASNPFSVTLNSCVGTATSAIAIWIDLNKNGVFDATEKLYVSPTSSSTYPNTTSGNLDIPATLTTGGTDTITGITRLRIVNTATSTPSSITACGSYTYGETEDYLVNIQKSNKCTGAFIPAIVSTDDSICSGVNFTLSVDNIAGISGVNHQWQSSTVAAGGPFTNIVGATSSTYTGTQSVATWYRDSAFCTASLSPNYSNVKQVKASVICYCTPPASGTSSLDVISNVSFGGMTNSSGVFSSTPYGYTNYSSSVSAGVVNRGGKNAISISAGTLTQGVAVWIDFDHDQTFEASEYFSLGTTSTIINDSINIPITALTGITRMRIRSQRTSVIAAANACTGVAFGETEDYSINIVNCPTVTINTQPSNANIACASPASFIVAATATGTIYYRWQVRTTTLGNWADVVNGAVYSGASTSQLGVASVPFSYSGYAYRVLVNSACIIPDTSQIAYLFVTPSVITSFTAQPSDVSGACASTASFSFAVTTGASPKYKWQFRLNSNAQWLNVTNNATFSGDSTTTLTVNNLSNSYTGYQFRAYATGTCATTDTTNAATLTVNPVTSAVTIVSDADSNRACKGKKVTFTATPTNSSVISSSKAFTWFIANIAKANAASSGTTINVTSTEQLRVGNNYPLTVYSGSGSFVSGTYVVSKTSNSFVVSTVPIVALASGSVIAQQLQSDGNVVFADSTYADSSLVYCSYAIASASGCVTPNPAISNTLTMRRNDTTHASITITSSAGSTICSGRSVTFSATQSQGAASSYDWYIGSSFVTRSATYVTDTLKNNQVISCKWIPTDFCASPTTVVSNAITMTVNTTYTVSDTIASSIPPVSGVVSICSGTSVTFTSTPTNGGASPAYQWLKNGVAISGETNATYTTTTLTNGNVISCKLTSSYACTIGSPDTSNIISITITSGFTPSVTLTNPAVCAGSSAVYKATPTNGGAGPLYTFYKNGSLVLGPSAVDSLITSPSASDVIKVKLTSNLSCASPDSAIATAIADVKTLPIAPTAGNNSGCNATSVVLSATPGAGETIDWYAAASGGSALTTPSLTYTIPSLTATVTYYAQARNTTTGCISSSRAGVIATLTSGNSGALLAGTYTIGGSGCTDFATLDTIIKYLNASAMKGNITIQVPAGYTETAPTGGYALGSTKLNDSSKLYRIKFVKYGSGSNPKIRAYTGGTATNTSAIPDGIWSLRGIDNVTIDGIDLTDSSANSGNALMEYGYGMFKFSLNDGAQRDTIKNCVVTLNRNNISNGTVPMVDGSAGIIVLNSLATTATTAVTPTLATGSNSFNAFYSNTIQNCNTGIALIGFAASSPYSLADTLNDVGGNSAALGNTIKNFGGGTSATGTAVAVRANNQRAVNISYNTINNNDGSGVNHGGSNLRGIQGESGAASTGTNVTINQNKITLVGSAASTTINGIDNGMGGSSVVNPNQTVNINNNYVTGGNGSATSGAFTGVQNSSVCFNLNMNYDTVQNTTLTGGGAWNGVYVSGSSCVNVNLNNNLIDNNNIVSTGTSFAPIFTPAVVTSASLSNNTISRNTKAIVGSGTYSLLNFSATSANCSTTINGNTITDNKDSLTSSGAFTLNCINAASCLALTTNNNFIRNNGVILASNASFGVTVNGCKDLSSGIVTTSNNTIRRLFISASGAPTSFVQNTIYGINSLPLSSTNTKNIYSNKIDSLYTNGSYSAIIAGINNSSGSSVNIYKNKIHSLLPGYYTAQKTYAVGIRLQTMPNSTSNIYNNMVSIDYSNNLGISGTTANAVNNVDGMKGIELPATASTNAYYNVYNNAIRMQGTGTTLFGSTGIYHFANSTSTTGRLRLMNNIISNETTVQGAAIVTAIRRSNANTFVNWSIDTTNNNSLYAGTPSATNLLYYDTTSSYSSLSDYKNAVSVSPRDANSISVKPVFISSIDLHLDSTNATNSAFDSTGARVSNFTSAYTDDIDGDTRNTLKPDMGADEFNINISCIAGSWLGTVSTDWNASGNWCSNAIPDGNTNISFAAGRTFYPVITNTTTPVCNNITIANGASVRLGVGGKLKINGTIANTGTGAIDATNGTIEMAASTIATKSFKNNNVRNLIIANNVTLSDTLNVLGRLSFSGSNRTFATAGYLNLKSSDSLTASVYRIDRDIAGGAISGNTITGDVYVERYISSRKAWRFLSMPTTHNLQFVKAAWQEGATSVSSNPKSGYGIKISDNRSDWSSNGFDSYASSGPTVKYLSLNNWVGIPSTNSYKFELGKGYMTYINGDRGVTYPSFSSTILREKGALAIGEVNVDLSSPLQTAGPYYLGLGNPYASAITLKNLAQSGLEKNYWVWDPKLSGTSSSGAYALISVDVNGNISVNPSGNGGSYVQNNYVESGSGFIVKTVGANATSGVNVTFKETDKIDSNFLVTRTAPLKSFRTNLYEVQNGQTYLVDGVLNLFDDSYSNGIDAYDATKFTNPGENISVLHYNQNISIERRRDLQNTDTIQYSVSRMKIMSYKFDFIPERMDEMNTNAYLFDKYLNTKTSISLTESSSIEFDVTSDAASYATNRFAILFEGNKPLPVSFVSIQATKKDNHVAVLWAVENEINIDQYVIEHSSDGKNFTSFATLKATGMNQYQMADENPFGTVSYYRVKALDKNLGYNYSRVVKVSTEHMPIVSAYPNPVKSDRIVTIKISNVEKSTVNLKMIANNGQAVYTKSINHAGGSVDYPIHLDKKILNGNYTLEVSNGNNLKSVIKLVL